MLSRVGIELPDHALAVSGLVGLDKKQHFAHEFLPELAKRAAGSGDLVGFVDGWLASYGKDPRELVAAGVAAWLPGAGLPPAAEQAVREVFSLGS